MLDSTPGRWLRHGCKSTYIPGYIDIIVIYVWEMCEWGRFSSKSSSTLTSGLSKSNGKPSIDRLSQPDWHRVRSRLNFHKTCKTTLSTSGHLWPTLGILPWANANVHLNSVFFATMLHRSFCKAMMVRDDAQQYDPSQDDRLRGEKEDPTYQAR